MLLCTCTYSSILVDKKMSIVGVEEGEVEL